MIRFKCEHCGGMVRSPVRGIGRRGRCSICNESMMIPNENYTLVDDYRRTTPIKENPGSDILLTKEHFPILESLAGEDLEKKNSFSDFFFLKKLYFPFLVQFCWVTGACLSILWFVFSVVLATAWASHLYDHFPVAHMLSPLFLIVALRIICEAAMVQWQTLDVLQAILKNQEKD